MSTPAVGVFRTLLSHVHAQEMDVLVLLDGDGQHVPADILDVAAPLEGECDMTIGSRYKAHESTETPLHRRFGPRVLDYLILGPSGHNLTDIQSRFRALSAEAASRLTIRTDGMGVESEMIGQAAEKALEIEELPIDVRYDGIDGQRYSPMQHGLTVAAFLTQLIREPAPDAVLWAAGAVPLAVRWDSDDAQCVSVFCGLVLNQVQNRIRNLKT